MIDFIRSHLVWKIFLSYLLVILVGGLVIVISMNLYLRPAIGHHMIVIDGSMLPLMFNFSGFDLVENFRLAMNETLELSGLAAFCLAGIASLYISRRLTAPVKIMMEASQRIAQGDYSKRVPANEKNNADELDQLAHSYNQMTEKLQKIEEMRRQLLADVSHELRTPLTAIKGSMEGLVDGVLPANRETYESIYHEADRLQRLVEDLHELSRVQSSGLVLHIKDININSIVRAAQKRLQTAFNNKKIHLSAHVDKNIPKIQADDDRVMQVLINLLSNSLQFTQPGGFVAINVRKEKDELVTSVQDDGIGIRASDLPHIFERFYRADKSRSRAEGGGSGIGLTIAQSLVHAHGGRIWAESAGEGKGSTFYFSLPMHGNHKS
jgi:signal transduction histidine kinase